MNLVPRFYQSEAEEAAVRELRRSLDPILIEAATGAGKSIIVTLVAHAMWGLSGGKSVLCLAPSAELTEQNYEKYLLTGEPASVYSASVGKKDLRHPVIFGTPGTVKGAASKIAHRICCVVVDEAHGMTPTIRHIIEDIRAVNPKVRVLGLTATPYVLGEGYIYRMDENGKAHGDDKAKDPYFMRKVYTIGARTLIDLGFLTEPIIGAIGVGAKYDTSGIERAVSEGRSKAEVEREIDRAFTGRGRLTADIVADVVHQSQGKQGVMIFAATIQHAEEVMESLPPQLSAMVTGKTPKKDRKAIIKAFKQKKIKYLVNVAVLTTGFDASHVDVVAILRYTDSVALLQQIIGRGLRIDELKDFLLVLDYAGNLEKHCPDGDIFAPEIKASMTNGGGGSISCLCPDCNGENTFSARKNDPGYEIDQFGYFLDLEGNRVVTDGEAKLPIPAHFGRRCQHFILNRRDGFSYQCGYRWSCKVCEACDADNDIAARYCTKCRGELIDPNEKLCIDFRKMKRDPTQLQTDEVISVTEVPGVSSKGDDQIRLDIVTPYRNFSIWLQPEGRATIQKKDWARYLEATNDREFQPFTVTYKKDISSQFYRVYFWNKPKDEEPEGYDHSKRIKDYA